MFFCFCFFEVEFEFEEGLGWGGGGRGGERRWWGECRSLPLFSFHCLPSFPLHLLSSLFKSNLPFLQTSDFFLKLQRVGVWLLRLRLRLLLLLLLLLRRLLLRRRLLLLLGWLLRRRRREFCLVL